MKDWISYLSNLYKTNDGVQRYLQVQQLISEESNKKDSKGLSLVMAACVLNDPYTIDMVIHQGVSLDSRDNDGRTVLHYATNICEYENTGGSLLKLILDAILECGVDVNSRDNAGWTALHLACMKGNKQAAIRLLECGALPNNSEELTHAGVSWTPLSLAKAYGHIEIKDILIQHGAKVDKPTLNIVAL